MNGQKRILIIDDNITYADVLSRNFESQGYKTSTVHKGLEGLYCARIENPDLIILDLSLPDIDGHKICKLIKHDPELKQIPIMVITGNDVQKDAEKAFLEGADAFLEKPTSLDKILVTIKKLI